ncbi:MAG: hypothetical protein K0S24_4956 [Sphingobacterium sp.]|jgi:hypothetical protein|nr:hypothetical protein [Sphingobacterium sp.]
MSLYQFIACDNELPELFSNKKRLQSGEMIKSFNTIEHYTDLEILCPINEYYDDIPYYTNKKHIYSLEWNYSDDNVKKLWQYLKDIHSDDIEIEIWSISLCDFFRLEEEILYKLEKTKRVYCPMYKLSMDILKASVECGDSGKTPNVIIIK